jgi:hypothetical protein
MPTPRALGSTAGIVLAAALIGCTPSSGARSPLGPAWSVVPSVPARARSVDVVVWEGSCWGSSAFVRHVTVGDDLVVVRGDEQVRVEPLDGWETKRARFNALLAQTRPRQVGTKQAPRFDHCKAGANYDCGMMLSIDGGEPVQACCGEAGMALAGFVREL